MRRESRIHLVLYMLVLLGLMGTVGSYADTNVALNKPATANHWSAPPYGAVDGDIETSWNAGHWATPSNPYWLLVDLEGVYRPDHIVLYGDEATNWSAYYYVDYVLEYSEDNVHWYLIQTGKLYDDPTNYPGDPIDNVDDVPLSGEIAMRYVRVTIVGGTHWAHLAELQVYADPFDVTYEGDSLLSTEGNPTVDAYLAATLRDGEGNVVDVDGEEVTFTLTADGIGVIVATGYSVNGVAEAVEPLAPAIYDVDISVEGSDATAHAILVVFNPEGGFTTGGGWIVPQEDGLNTYPNQRANFGFNAKYKNGLSSGHIEFRYSDGYMDLKSTSIEQLVITGGQIAQFKGWASVNQEEANWFFVKAIDNSDPGTGIDTFEIKVWAPGVSPESDPTERAGGILSGGNIVVHAKN